ncbi:G5 domain-containing protein, partial [Streptococcus oralis]|uniref:G5 domain-containing protein n=1 Tax=Streptococcus oralis TaxID=1303 RepID=UPI00255349DE
MKHQFYGEKRQRFSFRKLSVGLVSATIGSFFLNGQMAGGLTSVKAAEIQSQQSAQVKYHYVVESELTEVEKSALIREIPKYVEDASETYYLVYRPTTHVDSSGVLPKTGHSGLWESTFTAMGLALLVLVVVRGRNGKRYLSSLLLVTGMGSMLLSPTVLAVTNIELAAYNQSLNLGLGDALPAPLKIDGYDYIGYLKNEEQNDSHLAPSALKENPALDLEKEKERDLKPSETNLDMKEIVSDKGDDLTEEEREAIAAKERESARLSTVYDLPELKISEQESVHELPYQTKYQYTDELAQGQSKVIQSGVRGQRTVVTRHYHENQEIVKSEMISDQVTLEPVSEIILVGTAPTNSIPKETPVHEVPKLSEYGTTPETAPVHEVPELTEYGTSPETTPVHEVSELKEYGTNPDTAPVHEVPELTEYGTTPETAPVHEVPELAEYGTSPETTPVQEIPELTEYGTTPDTAAIHENSELELTTNDEVRIEKIDFSIDEQYTDEIPEGSRQIATPGVEGERTIKTRVYSSNGQEVDRQELSNEETLAPVTQIVKVGTAKPTMVPSEAPKADALPEYPLTYTDEIRVEKIAFNIEEQYTDELVRDARQIATPGVEGERTIKTRVYSSNGQEIDRQELSNEETLEPVTQIVKVGTAKPTMVPNEAPKAEALPEYPLTYTDEIRVEKIAFNIEEQTTDELVQDARQIATPGVQGERTIKTRVYSSNGQEIDRQELSNEETLAPVTQIVKVGTAKPTMVPSDAPKADALPEYPLTYTDEIRVEKIAFNIEEQTTDELVQDARQITTPGVEGERTIKTRVYSSNGQEVDRQELSNEETLAPVTQIVKVGTAKPNMVPNDPPKADALPEYPLTYTDETRVEKINFSIREEETDELVQDARQIATPGVEGERTIKTRVYSSNGQEIDRQELSNEETLAPVTQVVKVGTAKPTMVPNEAPKADALPEYPLTYTDETRVEKINFSIREEETDELVQDARQIATPGVQGERTIKTRVYSSNGQVVDHQELSDEETLAPVTQIVKVGTAKPTMVPNDAPKADALPEYPLTYTDETRVEKIAFNIEEQHTDELVQDARQIATPGVQGERTIKTRVYNSNGQEIDRQELSNEETLAPVTQIVKVGTAKPTMIPNDAPKADALPEYPLTYTDETRVERINFTIREEETDELVRDARQIATPGVQGERTIKTRVYSSNGQVVNRQELSNEETLAPVTQIVKVGTAKPTMVPNEAPKADALPEYPLTYTDETRVEKINFTIREEETDELVRDARQITTPGVEGERTIKTRVYSSNGHEIDRQELSNEETLAPVTQIVKVGTAKPTMVPNNSPKAEALPEYPLTYTDETRVEKINFSIREEETDELVRDARQIATPGVQGERTIKTRVYSSNGQEIDRQELSNEETLAPVTQIVKVGTAKPSMVPNDAPKADALEEFDLISLHNLLAEADQIKAQARYFNDSQSHQANYDAALTAGQAILSQSQASQAEVNQLVEQINQAKAQLSGLEVVKTALQTEYDLNPRVKTSVKYKNADSEKQTAYTDELTKAEGVLNNQTATQVQVNQALVSLTAAKEALNGVPKVKPTVSILSLTENADDKSVTVQYRLEDQTKSFRSATAELYQGDQLVRTLPITNFAGSLKIGDLDYYTGYTLKTKLTYELDNGSFTEFETDSRNFELEYKKIAFRDIDSVEFYHKENDQYKRFVSMSSMPTDLSTYFVKIKSSESKEILLPVHSISEAEKDGKAVYKVNVALPELVQESETGYKSGHDFYISKAVPSQQNVYTSFAGLVDAMKRNMAGNYVLGADLDASEVNLAPADYVYLKGNFTGSLTGSQNGKQYAIYNLAKPLFENMKNGSSITNIDFKNVNIVGTYDSAALARNAENARITDVSVQGKVSVVGNASNVAGLVVNGTNTQITNSSFTGTILSNNQHIKAYNVGGLVASLKGEESLLSQSKADVTIISGARSNEQRIGGLVGRLENNARITKSYVTGKLYNSTTNGQIGGVVGSNYFNGLVDNVISNVS